MKRKSHTNYVPKHLVGIATNILQGVLYTYCMTNMFFFPPLLFGLCLTCDIDTEADTVDSMLLSTLYYHTLAISNKTFIFCQPFRMSCSHLHSN